MAGHPKVSVVVPVYNPGPNIDGLVSSLDAQSLSPDELEVVFVDDGSTDGTYERLLEVASTRPHVVVTTIANSGWPGRPRNVGTDLAHGKYVFYADHDDEFFPEALERMYAMATANGSDVVYGKVVRMGLQTPYWELAKADKDRADLVEDHLLVSRSTHKLFRREFLVDNHIRFLEGRVRLEDHHFMGQVLACRPVVSILASEPCYRWIHRKDGTNTSSQGVDLQSYFGYFTASVELLQTEGVENRIRDEIAVVSAQRMFLAVRPRSWFKKDQPDKQKAATALCGFLEKCVPARLDHRLPILKRLAVQALRTGELNRFEQVQMRRTRIRFGLSSAQVAWVDGRLLVGVDTSLLDLEGGPLAMDQVGNDLALPPALGGSGAGAAPCLLNAAERGTGEITIRHRQIGIEWPVESISHPQAPPTPDNATLGTHVDGTVDAARNIFGRKLEAGIWDVLIRMQFLGEQQVRRVPIDTETPLPGPCQVECRQVLVYRTQSGTLALKISAGASPSPIGVLTAGWEKDDLAVALDGPVTGSDKQLVVRRRGTDTEQLAVVHEGRARILLGPSVRGDIFDFWLRAPTGPGGQQDHRLAYGTADVTQRLPYRIYDTVHGSFSVKNIEPPPKPTQGARKWLTRKVWNAATKVPKLLAFSHRGRSS